MQGSVTMHCAYMQYNQKHIMYPWFSKNYGSNPSEFFEGLIDMVCLFILVVFWCEHYDFVVTTIDVELFRTGSTPLCGWKSEHSK